MLILLKNVTKILDPADLRRVYKLLALSIVAAFFEVLGIGSIVPFIAVLSDPNVVQANPYLNSIYEWLGFSSPYAFLGLLAGVVIAMTIIRNALFILHQWMSAYSSALFVHSLSSRLLKNYLSQPYTFFLERNPVELQRNVVEECNKVVNGVLNPVVSVLTNLITAVAIVAFLILIKPMVAVITIAVLAGCYLIIYALVNRRMRSLSIARKEYRRRRFKLASEALSGIKPLILGGLQRGYAEDYKKNSLRNAMADAKGQVISFIPRYGIETVAIIGLASFAVYEEVANRRGVSVLPLLSLYLLAGYRLLPALQSLYAGLVSMRFDSASFALVEEHLAIATEKLAAADRGFRLQEEIRLENVSYKYPNQDKQAVSTISLAIKSKQSVALVGRSGAGKSTLVDLILGLMRPDGGEVCIDGRALESVKASWQQQIGYVPQHIYLSDDSVARNIAFGVDQDDIDHDAVIRAGKIADIHDFVIQELANGYDTLVGDRGIRLSGGQRQRIGIARAMYRKPSVLVLDEATSALDGATEHVVIEAIQRLSRDITIILIAHRTSTVQFCDKIFVLRNGRLVDQGDYKTLSNHSNEFRALANLADGKT